MLPMDVPGCHALGVESDGQRLIVLVAGDATKQTCPDCGYESDAVHSVYVRTPRDLPVQGRCLRVQLMVRRWRCLNRTCSRATFCESFQGFAGRYAQRSERMTRFLEHLILNVGSNMGAHLAQLMGLEVSGRTLLRVGGQGEVQAPTPRVLGLDDFAIRRGRTYGTLLCDLDTGEPIDVVLGRTKEPVLEWLKNRSGIEIVARDRASSYADAINTGAPQAIQVADRFHLVKNVTDALKEVVDRQSWALPEPAPLPVSVSEEEIAPEPEPIFDRRAKRLTRAEQKRAASAERLQRRYEEVQQLRSSGMSIRQIRMATGLSAPTILRYIHSSMVPKRAERRRVPSQLDPFMAFLRERWQAGCRNARTLFEEIMDQGYTGSLVNLRRLVSPWRAECPPPPKTQRPPREDVHQVRKVNWGEVRKAVLCPPEHLNDVRRQSLQDFLLLHPKLARARDLVYQFRLLLKDQDVAALDTWLTAAARSELAPFERLARTLNADRKAVLAAVELPWSTGPVEGHITRVKLIKRIGYGRAGLTLLKARILYRAQMNSRPRKNQSLRKGANQHAVA